MNELQLQTFLIWLVGILGTSLIAVCVFGLRLLLNHLSKQDDQLEDIHSLIQVNISNLRSLYHDVDKRVVRLEARYNIYSGSNFSEREEDAGGGKKEHD